MFVIKVFLQIVADFANTSELKGNSIASSILIHRA